MNKLAILIILIYFVLDFIWIYFTKPIWDEMVPKIQKTPFKPRIIYAVLSYITIACGLVYFGSKSPIDALIFGIVAYGVFDLTNMALFTEYKWQVALMDMLWGGFVCFISVYIAHKIFSSVDEN